MNKKSKPKQRTNWKQRALHCEEVIAVLNAVGKSREAKLEDKASALRYWQARNEKIRVELEDTANKYAAEILAHDETSKRAEQAEKQNALLLQGNTPRHCQICAENNPPTCDGRCELIKFWKRPTPRTHWQCFKSFLKHWYVELLCLIVILCVTAGCVAYVYWPRG